MFAVRFPKIGGPVAARGVLGIDDGHVQRVEDRADHKGGADVMEK